MKIEATDLQELLELQIPIMCVSEHLDIGMTPTLTLICSGMPGFNLHAKLYEKEKKEVYKYISTK